MDFTWSAEQDAYRMDVRKWLEANRPQSLAPRRRRGSRRRRRNLAAPQELAQKALSRRMGGAHVAQGIRRPRRHLHRAGHLSAGTRPPQPADGMQRARRHHDRPRADAMGHRRAEKALPESDPRGRRDLVRGNVGAGRGFRPRVDPMQGRAQGRRVYRQRPEGLDHDRASRRLRAALRAHRSRRAQAQGHERAAGRYESARRDGPSAQADHRRQRVQRNLFRRRARAQGKSARPDQHGMAGAGLDPDA